MPSSRKALHTPKLCRGGGLQANLCSAAWRLAYAAASTVATTAAIAGIILPLAARADEPNASACPPPVLSRLTEHRVTSGETLETIARDYTLLPATLIGLNPDLANRTLSPGMTLQIPPYNGVITRPSPGMTWQDLGDRYGVRADVLFELNGCQDIAEVVFVPGVNWSPRDGQALSVQLPGYPLPETAAVIADYGWRVNAAQDDVEFHSGVDLEAAMGTPVLAVEGGVVAFAGSQGSYGNLVVINHQDGLQSRYAQLGEIQVSVGQSVARGDAIATSGQSAATSPHLHFEVRENSEMGWVARDPSNYIDSLQMFSR
ncbi:MAG: LysM peptidoglycan-binding domain-containing M23 family metallopeptidase [Elainellaceae cyanobacterium]